MMHLLVIVSALAIHVAGTGGWTPPVALPAMLVVPATALPILGALLLVHAHCLLAARAIDRSGNARVAFVAERAASWCRAFTCAWVGGSAIVLGWVHTAGGLAEAAGIPRTAAMLAAELAGVIAMTGAIGAAWWSYAPIDRRLREAMLLRRLDLGGALPDFPGRWAFTVSRLRDTVLMGLVPVVLLLTLASALAWIGSRVAGAAAGGASWAAWLPEWAITRGGVFHISNLLQGAGLGLALLLMPIVQRRMWNTVTLGPGPLRDRIEALCRRAGARLRDILVWRTGGISVNAAVLGALPRVRFLLFTDGLLHAMPADQVSAVAAHEIGHLRHHHVAWLLAGAGLVLVGLSEAGARLGDAAGLSTPGADMLSLALALGAGLPILGAMSRRFEWQADAYAASLLSRSGDTIEPEAVRLVSSALLHASALGGMNPNAISWRHGSTAQRVERLGRLGGLHPARLPTDRAARRIKAAIVVGWAILIVLASW